MAIQSSPRTGFGPRFGIEVVGLVAALAAGVGIGALVFDGDGGSSSSVSVSQGPVVNEPPRVASAPGVGELSDPAVIASAKAAHDAYMDAHFGPYVDQRPNESSVLGEANRQGLPPFSNYELPKAQESGGFDLDHARAEHDTLLPAGGN